MNPTPLDIATGYAHGAGLFCRQARSVRPDAWCATALREAAQWYRAQTRICLTALDIEDRRQALAAYRAGWRLARCTK